jgi:hypothetical protein
MLFDLQGKRRRVVQATYLTLAVLMGGGLVLFGIGGDVSGGLFDAFSGNDGGGGNGNSVVEKRVDRNLEKVRANPKSEAARKALVRDYYQLAVSQTDATATTVPDDAKDELRRSAAQWNAYLALEPSKPDSSLARVALEVFGPAGLNRPKEAQEAARVIAEAENSTNAYLNLVQYAALAGDNRTADLAGQKAVDLAPKAQRKQVEAQIEQLKSPQGAAGAQGGASGGATQP